VPEEHTQDPVISFGAFRLFPRSRLLEKDGAPLHVGGRALDILLVLAERPGEVVDKRELIRRVWADVNVDEGSLRFHITALRKALGDGAAGTRYIVNVPGRGYCFAATPTAAEPVAPPPPVANDLIRARALPPAHAKLIGRTEAIEKISTELAQHRMITVVGHGGIGKTSVALAVGHRQLAAFGGQIFFVDFGALSDAKLVPTAIASALGLAVSSEDPLPGLLTFLGDRRTLLVLDSCEHIVDALAPLAERIVQEAPQSHILATSRESLRIESERIYRLFPLNCPPRQGGINVTDIKTYPATQLFMERVAASSSGFELSEDEAPLVAEICQRLDGIPLAIELAAGRVSAYGIAGIASLLDSRFSLLWRGRRTAIPRHQTLSAALDWSYSLLSDVESTTLRRLSVFAGPFALEAAAMVASGEGVDQPEIVEAIANLVSKSLISLSATRPARYRLLDTTRAYALDKLKQASETATFARRHAEYFRDSFEHAEAEGETRTIGEWLAAYGAEIDNVRAALDWAFSPDGDATLGVALTVAVVPLWVRLSLFSECRERVERALAKFDLGTEDSDRVRMKLSAALGWSLMYGEGRAREAGPALATTLELAERLDDKDFRLRALWGLCIDQFNNGEFGKALEFSHRFTDAAAHSSDRTDPMLADRLMAVSLHYLGDQDGARRHIDRVDANLHVLADNPRIFPLDLRVSTQYFRARILWLQGFADQALGLVAKNIEEGRAIGHALTFCSVLGQSACPIALLAGDLDAAERHATALIEHTDRHAIRVWRLWAGAFKAAVQARHGDLDGGLALLRNELHRAGDARYLPRFLFLVGELAACLGEANEIGQGLAVVDDALERCKTRQEQWYVPELLRIKGELMRKEAEPAAAEPCFAQALELARRQGALFWVLRSATSLARLKLAQDRKTEARKILQPVCKAFPEGREIADLRAATALLGSLDG
jgi:predicted ATPase/DNA-binding winged helix-turn-helix (wHTH) protein